MWYLIICGYLRIYRHAFVFKGNLYAVAFTVILIISGRVIDQKLQVAGLAKFSLAPGDKPYKIAAYIPGSKVKDITLFIHTCVYL